MNRPTPKPQAAAAPASLSLTPTQRLDIPSLCRQGHVLSGQTPLAQFERLCTCRGVWPQQNATEVTWTLTPKLRHASGDADQLWISLDMQTDIFLECQRCLERTDATLTVNKQFRFVHTEADLDRVDALFEAADSDDEALLLDAGGWPVMDWLEDELIMALPIAPRHDDCQMLNAIDDNPLIEERPNPFAVLKTLKP